MNKWKLISSKKALESKWFTVRQDTVELPNGKVLEDYFVWECADSCMIVPVTKEMDTILIRQYKHGRGEIITEFPAGYADPNEDIINTAARELEEETGYKSDKLTILGRLTQNPTKQTGDIYVILAENAVETGERAHEETEDIELITVPLRKVLPMIQSGEIRTTTAAAATLLALTHLGLIAIES